MENPEEQVMIFFCMCACVCLTFEYLPDATLAKKMTLMGPQIRMYGILQYSMEKLMDV